MSDLKRKAVKNALIGTIIGMMIAIMIYVLGGYDEPEPPRLKLLIQVLGSGLLGAVNMGCTFIYDIEDWGLIRVTFTHYAISLGSFLVANVVLGWFALSIMPFVFIAFTVAYFIIWFIMYLCWNKEVRRMNEELHQMRQEKKDTPQPGRKKE